MNIFISWSGERSRRVAELLKHWVKCVIQSTKPWISTNDIERGSVWATVIGSQLQDSTNGIICITKENKNAPWILFEAGALAKGLQTSRIYTLLIDLEPADISGPLAQFNHTRPGRDDMRKLINTININSASPLENELLNQSFDAFWNDFETKFKEIIDTTKETKDAPQPSQNDSTREIISTLRNIQSRLSDIENNNARNFVAINPPFTVGGLEDFPIYPHDGLQVKNYVSNDVKKSYAETLLQKELAKRNQNKS